jgi:excisionase family DNA binding protein
MFEHTDEILNIDQFCEFLDMGKSTGYNLLKSGKIKGFKIGKKWKIPAKSIEDFILKRIRYAE